MDHPRPFRLSFGAAHGAVFAVTDAAQVRAGEPLGVLAGLVPAIPRRMRSIRPHAEPLQETFEVGVFRTAWSPRQARARRAGVVCDLRFTTGLAEPDSRGLVLGIHAQ